MNNVVKGDILKSPESGRLIDDLGTLQYLFIFPKEEGHKFHYTGKAASIIQRIDEGVTSGCKYEEDVKHQKIFNVELPILLKKMYLVD